MQLDKSGNDGSHQMRIDYINTYLRRLLISLHSVSAIL